MPAPVTNATLTPELALACMPLSSLCHVFGAS
ncbi:Uncharacterised protein [Bordetella pertussis]|nr:Uncharacterised protein [Bordetella pertussis]CFO08812.1 Uncharacterised protein [Bordetella pertussis]CFO75859.1 Uncharacterised protein [Bordetella pertussis]CFP62126.1 Uncharacterised protein [Bordetella pertussis]CPL67510.1 Uncharacterised protein [Bordetella pertussis]